MVDSDIDSWYDWERGDDSDIHGRDIGARRNVRLMGSDSLPNVMADDGYKGSHRSNGMIRYGAVPKSARSGTEVRFINPAIYAETLNNEELEHDVEIQVKVSSKNDGPVLVNCGDSVKMTDMMSALSVNNDLGTAYVDHAGDQGSAQETYRCYSFNTSSPSAMSTTCGIVRSKSVTSCTPSCRVEGRCKVANSLDNNDELCSARQADTEVQRYMVNGRRIVQVASSSLSSIRISESRTNETEDAKKITYTEWIRKKLEAAKQRKEDEDQVEKRRQMEAEKQAREKEERESRERENFLKWSKKKKKEGERRKAVVEKELELQKQLKEIEDKAGVVKTLYLRQWERKKKEEEKVRQKKVEIQQKQEEEGRKKRLEESTRAYEHWRKMAKNKPKPATQGLLPHQKAKPAYVNPTPWQRIVDDVEDVEEDALNFGKKTQQSQSKISTRRSAVSYR